MPVVTSESWKQLHVNEGKSISEVLLSTLLPAAFSAGCSFPRFAVDRGIRKTEFMQAIQSFFAETCLETRHPPVHVQTRDGGEWITHPMTFFVRNPTVSLDLWLRLQQDRGFLQRLPPGTTQLVMSWYWDKGARTIAGYPVSILMVSFPQLFRRPGSLGSVFPLVVHAGSMPAFEEPVPSRPARPAKGKLPARRRRPGKPGKPAVKETVHTIAADALNSIRTLAVPETLLSDELRSIGVHSLPVYMENISDQAAVADICPDVATGSTIRFPAKFSDPSKTSFVNGLRTQPSAECFCTSAEILHPDTACATRPRGPLRFFVGARGVVPVTCTRAYCRHALVHGHPAIDADISCFLYRCGFEYEAELISSSLPAPYDPLHHIRRDPEPAVPAAVPPEAAEEEGPTSNAERPVWAVRLSYVTDSLRELRVGLRRALQRHPAVGGKVRYVCPDGRPTLLNIYDVLKETKLSFPLPDAGLSKYAKPDPAASSPQLYTVAQHHHDVIHYALWCLYPDADGVPPAEEVQALGRDILVRHKSLLACSVPWRAPVDDVPIPVWYERLLASSVPQAISVATIRFCGNATALAQSLHEFCLGAAAAMVRHGKIIAASMHEEAFERLFLYWWLITFVMGGLLSSREARLRFSVTLLFAAVFAGCPTMQNLSSADFRHRAYQGKKRKNRFRKEQPQEHASGAGVDDAYAGVPESHPLPRTDPLRDVSPVRRDRLRDRRDPPDAEGVFWTSDLWDGG